MASKVRARTPPARRLRDGREVRRGAGVRVGVRRGARPGAGAGAEPSVPAPRVASPDPDPASWWGPAAGSGAGGWRGRMGRACVLERDEAERKRERRFWEAAEGWRQAYRAGAADRDALWWKTVPRESCSARSCDRWKLRD